MAETPARGELRVECEHAERCGGCPAIGLPYDEQLSLKRGRVVGSVARYAALELVYTDPVAPADPVVGYRTRAKLMVGPGGALGLYAKGGGHVVVDVPRCRVLSPLLARVADAVCARLADGGLAAPDGPRPWSLRSVDLREVDDGAERKALVTLVVHRPAASPKTDGEDLLRAQANALREEIPQIVGVAVNYHDGESVQVLGAETRLLAGEPRATDRIGGSTQVATFGSFVQAHRGQAARVHALVLEALRAAGPSPRVLDLYGGSGAIALSMAAAGARVHMVESFAPAVRSALEAARATGVTLTAEAMDAATALRAMAERKERFDVVVVNPPRRGTSPLAREWLGRLAPERVVYVSCDPETLARDLDHFTRLGWAVGWLRPLDMIPLTDEVETVALMRRAPAPRPRVHWEDDDLLVVEKGPHEPTVPNGEYGLSLLDRVRKIAPEATPVYRLDVGTSGVVLFAKRASAVSAWQRAWAAGATREIYLAATRGVTPTKGAIARELRENGRSLPARTRYRRLAVAGGHSVLRVVPEQGHTHQIRRHLAAIGHPLLGDDRYGHAPTNRYFEEKQSLDRVFLHCVRVEVDHPTAGTRLVVEAPVPGDLRTVLERLSGPGTLRFLDQKNALGTAGASSLPPPPLESQRPPPDDAPSSTRDGATQEDDARPSFVPEPEGSRTSLTPGLVGGDAEDGEKL